MKRFVQSASRFLAVRKKNDTGVVKGSGRKYTNWAEHQEKQHSVMWLIEHAVTLEMLADVLKFANYQAEASNDTRRRWAAAAEQRMFILKRRPPKYETVEFKEAMDFFKKDVETLKLPDSVYATSFKQIRNKELMLLSARSSDAVLEATKMNFLPVAKDGPMQAPMSADIQALIDAAEVPRYIAPELRLAREGRGRMAKYSDGVQYGETVSQSVTEMRVVGRRHNCAPLPDIYITSKDGVAVAAEQCERIYEEWDIVFIRGDENITEAVVKESHPDTMRRSHVNPAAAVMSSMRGTTMAPMVWKKRIEDRYGVRIAYDQTMVVAPAAARGIPATIAKLDDLLSKLDAPPPLPR